MLQTRDNLILINCITSPIKDTFFPEHRLYGLSQMDRKRLHITTQKSLSWISNIFPEHIYIKIAMYPDVLFLAKHYIAADNKFSEPFIYFFTTPLSRIFCVADETVP